MAELVIIASSYKVAVPLMFLLITLHTSTRTPHKTSPGEGLQSRIALFLVYIFITSATEGEGGYVFAPLCLFVCLSVCMISQKVVEGFGSNLVERLGV